MNRLLFAVLLLMCGTAWGQVFTDWDKINAEKAKIRATADSLRLIRQVDIVLDYLKAQGYGLPKAEKPMYILRYNGFRFWSPDSVMVGIGKQ